ncbi:manganese efflux pump MntP family protein [Thalassorhabdus alkalitolerans]|uniref:Putative manganese efflux pump MntP n=1 Tax=Thalassorhabdus alkalitolerans TaxID=2282697 RepID=A0ABW0YIL5_9BACI|nr:manganese efflux pump [Thalassobacillus sp. C254]
MEEWIVLGIIAVALGMDAFSMSLAMGMNGIKVRERPKIASTIGMFHILMPLAGIAGGKWIASSFEQLALWVGGGLLILIGLQMIWTGVGSSSENNTITPRGLGLLLFALLVSLDSFSVGITLGIVGAKIVAVLLLFGLTSAVATWMGLFLGTHAKGVVGSYGEMLGGGILLAFGVKLLLPL